MALTQVIIGIGSNINPHLNIKKGLALIEQSFSILAQSNSLQTKALWMTDQADFINMVIKIETELTQQELKSQLKKIEDQCERDRKAPLNGPRTLDLDILVFGEKVIDPNIYEIPFWSELVSEIYPEAFK